MAPYRTSMTFPTAILVVNTGGLIISFIAVVLRFWVRKLRRTKLRLSDYTIVASWLFGLGLVISENFTVTRGAVGQPVQTTTVDELLFSTKQSLVIGITETLAVTFVKISLLDLLTEIFAACSVANVLMGISASYGISFTIVTLAGCRPFVANWDKISHPNYTCINTASFHVAHDAIGAILNIAILLLPVPIIWNLHLKGSKRVGVIFLFSIGILICAVSLARLVHNTRQTYMLTHFTEYAGIAVLLGALEVNLSIVCACLPVLQPLSNLNIEKARSTLGSSDAFRRIRSLFSSNRRKPTRDSIKLGSSMDRLSSESEMATTRYKRPIDKLHPLIAVSAGRPSVELRTDIGPETHDISATRASPGGFEMRSLDAEGQERITVTKTFEVR